MSDRDNADGDFTTAPECVSLTAEHTRLGRVSAASTVDSSRQSVNDSALRSHNAPSPLGRNSRNPASTPLSKVQCHGRGNVSKVLAAASISDATAAERQPRIWFLVCCTCQAPDEGEDVFVQDKSMDAPTLMAGAAREVSLAFEKAR
jgi:hypothetical protein